MKKSIAHKSGRFERECDRPDHFVHIKLGKVIERDHRAEPNWSRQTCVLCSTFIKHEIPIYE